MSVQPEGTVVKLAVLVFHSTLVIKKSPATHPAGADGLIELQVLQVAGVLLATYLIPTAAAADLSKTVKPTEACPEVVVVWKVPLGPALFKVS